MIGLPRGVEVYLFGEPCDMRRSFNTLTLVVEQKIAKTLTAGDLFVFVSADRKHCKVLYFDGTGLCLFAKRLKSGHHFPAPWKMKRAQLTLSELALFVEGASAVREKLSPAVIRRADLTLQPTDTEDLLK
jgi:transposase